MSLARCFLNGDSQTFDTVVEQSLYTPIFVGNYKGQITLGAASEMPTVANGDISADLKTWTIKMKPSLKWSDGQPYTADDVNYTWQLWDNPKFGAASTVGYNLITLCRCLFRQAHDYLPPQAAVCGIPGFVDGWWTRAFTLPTISAVWPPMPS